MTSGYLEIHVPGHPRARNHAYVFEHILIVERALGKVLRRDAEVHHVDRDRRNNAHGNLVACHDHAYHMLLHRRQRALDACGDPSAIRCKFCKRYDRQYDIATYTSKHDGLVAYHRSCNAEVKRDQARRRNRRALGGHERAAHESD